ncbi:hypothetical protein PIB30_047452 [Stylosanthes scabra]|uniref:Uncharacterized protein n=1 Tax=Stylosanthes scabra TaxID=79078 RepID=A0ABU6WEU5_9FABA|nr:hypothetical protein [Stylosanthes scabra]
MQAISSVLPELFTDFSSVSGNLDANFSLNTFCRDLSFRLKIDDTDQHDFTFPSADPPQGSLLAADEIFHNGRIRTTTSPHYDQSMLFSAADGDAGQESPLLPPPTKRRRETTTLAVETMETWQKCNSTGFSKLYRYRRDVKHRKNSEGTDAFVFLNRPPAPEMVEKKKEVVKCGKRKTAPSSWAHEEFYLMNRKRTESNKRRSFLPYKKHIFGLFSNMNGFSMSF